MNTKAITTSVITWIVAALSGETKAATICFIPHDRDSGLNAWAFEIGIAWITDKNITKLTTTGISIGDGPAGGEIYVLTASRKLGEFRWEIGGHTFKPRLELPLTLEIVDENSRSPFLDLNASLILRWVDFPWNDHVKTTIASGVGLSYSEKVYLMDRQRHPGSHRSHLKFNWPIQLTFAHPDYPNYQIMLFLIHQSGGHIFDQGGVNSLGIGYRHEF